MSASTKGIATTEALWNLCARGLAIRSSVSDDLKAEMKAFLSAMANYAIAEVKGEPIERWHNAALAEVDRTEAGFAKHVAIAGAPTEIQHDVHRLRVTLFSFMPRLARWPGTSVVGPVPLPTARVSELDTFASKPRWLIESLWGHGAVGVIGGHPKSRKTFLALEMAVAVASGTSCLGQFKADQGSVLLFMGEGQEAELSERLSLITQSRGTEPSTLPIEAIRTTRLLLDREEDQDRLAATVAAKQPKLLVLDPFVRLHTGDENDAGHVSRILGYLRGIQREYGVAIVLVHHYRKSISKNAIDGLGLRGSGDLHAWGDSNVYLQRGRSQIVLRAEHRAAPGAGPWDLVVESDPFVMLAHEQAIAPEGDAGRTSLADRVIEFLSEASAPKMRSEIREALKVRNERLGVALGDLVRDGGVVHTVDGRYEVGTGRP